MAIVLQMPQFGITMKEGTLTKWLVHEGDQITKGMPIYEVETDKYNNVVESEAEGTLLKIVMQAGDDVPVHGTVGILGAVGEDISSLLTGTPSAQPEQTVYRSAQVGDLAAAPIAAAASTPAPASAVVPDPTAFAVVVPTSRRVKASPLAKKTAKTLHVDLTQVKGTGMGNRIVQADVIAAKKALEVPTETPSLNTRGGTRTVKLSAMRRAISKNMSASWATAPMVTYHAVVEMTELKQVKEKLGRDGIRLSYTDLLTKIVSIVLLEHPYVNCSLEGDMVTFHDYVNIGIAVALEDGLVVPVVKNAHQKGLKDISSDIKTLADKARSGALIPDDTAEGTFTISNLGMYGIDNFTPIINQPQSAILGVNRICETAVVANGQLAMVPQMKLSLTADHRVIDGAEAAKTLRDIRVLCENPWKLLL